MGENFNAKGAGVAKFREGFGGDLIAANRLAERLNVYTRASEKIELGYG
jgi:hypothetical protein